MSVGTGEGLCGWCGATLGSAPERRRRRARCSLCGAWTIDPLPSDEELQAAYAEWYRPAEGRFSGVGDTLLRRLRATPAGRLDRIAPAGPVLDVGAGEGALIDALRTRGRSAVGIDPYSDRKEVVRMDLWEAEGDWAAIVFWHSLEHMPRAGAVLERAVSMLGSGGVLVVAMPNPDSIQAAVFGDRWFALDVPRHLVHVPAAALIAKARELGLSVERVSHLRGGQAFFGWLHGWVGRLPGRPDLYDAIRRPEARHAELSASARALAIGAALLLAPFAALAVLSEAVLHRGGSVYLEARRV